MIRPAKTDPLRAALVGTGRISEEHLSALCTIPSARVVAVCDLSPTVARYAADRFGVEHAYTDYRQMLADLYPGVMHVLTPPHTHVAMVTDCLNAGAHVIVEKPMAPSSAAFQGLWATAKRNQRHLIEDHNYRFNEPILALEALVAQGRLGRVCEVEVRMALDIRAPVGRYSDANLPHPSHQMPAGVIHEFITHLCYLALRFMPDHPLGQALATAQWRNLGGGELFKYDELDSMVVVGNMGARIRFSCQTRPEQFVITVRGSDGCTWCDLFQPCVQMIVPRAGGGQLSPLVNQFVNGRRLIAASVRNFVDKVRRKTPYHGLGRFLEQTYAALSNGGQPPVSNQDMNRASQFVDLLVASQENGRAQR